MKKVNIKKFIAEAIANAGLDNTSADGLVLDAQLILAEITGSDRLGLLAGIELEISDVEAHRFETLLKRRLKGEPLQYILNSACFMGLDFYVDEAVLIPRPETELMVDYILREIYKPDSTFIDMCTGSGCIGISIAKLAIKDKCMKRGLLIDISKDALNIARKNASKNEVIDEIDFLESDLFESLGDSNFIANLPENKVDFIVSNPPYINKADMEELSVEVKNEPNIALYGGEDGLDFYRELAARSGEYLKKGGALVVEIGYDEGAAVEGLFLENGFKEVEVIKDLNGLDRIVKGIYYV